jgi:NDP-sugar pyrophosphorylase family protein
MRAMMLCAGLSTRLGALGAERPKPMLPVCGVPIIRYGIANLVAHGITEIVINTHHKGELIRNELGDGRAFGARVQYIAEPTLLGTGGGLKHALPLLDPHGRDEPFLSINGKLIFDLNITDLVAAYRTAMLAQPLVGMLVVRRVPDATSWGAVDVASDGRIVNILDEGDYMFCGAHITRPSAMARLPMGESDSIRQGYLPWLRAGQLVLAYEHRSGYFAEHSTPERYLESNWELLRGAALRYPPTRLSGIDPTARIHHSAVIVDPVTIGAGATIGPNLTVGPYVVVGAGARIERSVTRTVVWEGAIASPANEDQSIVTGSKWV